MFCAGWPASDPRPLALEDATAPAREREMMQAGWQLDTGICSGDSEAVGHRVDRGRAGQVHNYAVASGGIGDHGAAGTDIDHALRGIADGHRAVVLDGRDQRV